MALCACHAAAPGKPCARHCGAFRACRTAAQWVAERDGVTWYNDSKGTNVGATRRGHAGNARAALVLIAGGDGKGADFTPLGRCGGARRRAP